MTDLTPNHPAVEAAARAMHAAYERRAERWEAFYTRTPWEAIGDTSQAEFIGYVHSPLNAALPRLTADNLRDTPAGRALKAEAWEEGAETAWGRTGEGFNGECAFDHLANRLDQPSATFRRYNPDTPNPYLEADA